ncbi:hypothetical protein CDAR_209131 [Caerostris darwini]|uniref:Uncharacterized protein n=1 Tax=Caerostris darwini TaxID=1538125 RepID=A0AAV4VHM6_9ARAC|nr:hypothetical protein CDAR_209131 [Caerostris darwini]
MVTECQQSDLLVSDSTINQRKGTEFSGILNPGVKSNNRSVIGSFGSGNHPNLPNGAKNGSLTRDAPDQPTSAGFLEDFLSFLLAFCSFFLLSNGK